MFFIILNLSDKRFNVTDHLTRFSSSYKEIWSLADQKLAENTHYQAEEPHYNFRIHARCPLIQLWASITLVGDCLVSPHHRKVSHGTEQLLNRSLARANIFHRKCGLCNTKIFARRRHMQLRWVRKQAMAAWAMLGRISRAEPANHFEFRVELPLRLNFTGMWRF